VKLPSLSPPLIRPWPYAALLLMTRFIDRIFLSHLAPSLSGIPLYCSVHTWYGKTVMAGPHSGKSRTMIDSDVLAQYINVTDIGKHVAVALRGVAKTVYT